MHLHLKTNKNILNYTNKLHLNNSKNAIVYFQWNIIKYWLKKYLRFEGLWVKFKKSFTNPIRNLQVKGVLWRKYDDDVDDQGDGNGGGGDGQQLPWTSNFVDQV